MSAASAVTLTSLTDLPEVSAGDDLSELLAAALVRLGVQPGERDVLVVAQKVISKAEGRGVDLATVTPSARAEELSLITCKDARLIELILAESTEVLRARPDVLIVRHRLGFVMANAGIDRSNVPAERAEVVLLLPKDPDGSAARLRAALAQRLGSPCGLIISDSFGRPWRKGVVNIALGAAGVGTLIDRRGAPDRFGRRLEVTEVAYADALAAAAGLVMGEAAESIPAVLIRGCLPSVPGQNAQALIRPLAEDLFR